METNKNTPLLTTSYQTALVKAELDVIAMRNEKNTEYYWNCLETLYYVCPKVVVDEIEPEVTKLLETLANLREDVVHVNSLRYKRKNADKFFKIIMDSLRKNKYTELEIGAKPKYETKGHLG